MTRWVRIAGSSRQPPSDLRLQGQRKAGVGARARRRGPAPARVSRRRPDFSSGAAVGVCGRVGGGERRQRVPPDTPPHLPGPVPVVVPSPTVAGGRPVPGTAGQLRSAPRGLPSPGHGRCLQPRAGFAPSETPALVSPRSLGSLLAPLRPLPASPRSEGGSVPLSCPERLAFSGSAVVFFGALPPVFVGPVAVAVV